MAFERIRSSRPVVEKAFEQYKEKGDEFFEEATERVKEAASAAQVWGKSTRKWLENQRVDVDAVEAFALKVGGEFKPRRVVEGLRRAIPPLNSALYECSSRWNAFEIDHPLRAQQLWNAGAGATGYLTTIAAGQRACGVLRLSVVSKKAISLASVIGFTTVALAGLVGGEAAHRASEWRRERVCPYVLERMSPPHLARNNVQRLEEMLMSLAFYKLLLGGRFRGVAPSDLRHPGAFASDFIPANGDQYAGYRERSHIQKIGWKRGCHTCGSRVPGGFLGLTKKWVADHQPPNKLVSMGEAQRFYPHCVSCSLRQSSVLRNVAMPLALHFPTPAAVLATVSLAIRPAFQAVGDAVDLLSEALSDDPPRPRPTEWMQHQAPPRQRQRPEPKEARRQAPRPAPARPTGAGRARPGARARESPSARFERPPPMPENGVYGGRGAAVGGGGFDWDAADRYDARDKKKRVAF